jgi:tRNA(Ile)-lysidine synthase
VFEQFLNHIKHRQLFSSSDGVLLAVSGGIDSMVMLHLFKEAGFNIAVAHCNFQLRAADSDGDELFVRDACERLGVAIHVQRFETLTYASENKLSVQMAARELRYKWFEEVIKKYSFNFLATAHHFDDSMETILLNLSKGASADRLTGIPLKNGNIIRPMLFASRNQIAAFAAEKKIDWREDQSNFSDDYQRNFIRHHIIPKLKEINPSLEVTWQQGIEKLEGDVELMQQAFGEWKMKFISEATDRIVINKRAFEAYTGSASILWRYIKQFGFNFDQSREVILALNGQPGKQFSSPTHQLVVDRDTIIILEPSGEWNEVFIHEEDRECSLGPWKLSFSNGDALLLSSRMQASLDADRLKFPLIWRRWKPGDSFQPLGMQHTKKLSDFLVDNKVSMADKDLVTVLESDGAIVYVVGWRIDERFKITEETKRLLNIYVARV